MTADFVMMLADTATNRVLAVPIVGPAAVSTSDARRRGPAVAHPARRR
jgi:hypothetical protein